MACGGEDGLLKLLKLEIQQGIIKQPARQVDISFRKVPCFRAKIFRNVTTFIRYENMTHFSCKRIQYLQFCMVIR